MSIQQGFKKIDRDQAAYLYASAFKRKFVNLIGDEDQVARLLAKGLNPHYCLTYYDKEKLVGLAGFHVGNNALVQLRLTDFIKQFGIWKGLLKGLLTGVLFYRSALPKGELLMDGIAVHHDYRGQGIGSQLFDALFSWASENGYKGIHLDVIDENPKAQNLYYRLGFRKTAYSKIPKPFAGLLGVTGVTHMKKTLN